ncbi:MAG: hypothetical protein Q8O83_00085 [bacterium]|nr:hypothetical protein [bacterium]
MYIFRNKPFSIMIAGSLHHPHTLPKTAFVLEMTATPTLQDNHKTIPVARTF